MNDKQKREAAVDAFAAAIKARLAEKCHQTGWDGAYPHANLCAEIAADLERVRSPHIRDLSNGSRLLVDIGARAMMLHFRLNEPTGEPTPPPPDKQCGTCGEKGKDKPC
jgi:hypothetical protein